MIAAVAWERKVATEETPRAEPEAMALDVVAETTAVAASIVEETTDGKEETVHCWSDCAASCGVSSKGIRNRLPWGDMGACRLRGDASCV